MPHPLTNWEAPRQRVFVLAWWNGPFDRPVTSLMTMRGSWTTDFVDLARVPEAQVVEHLRRNRFDGLIVQLDREGPVLDFCSSAGVPVIDLTEAHPQLDVPRVLLDEVAIGRMVGEHFLERGYRHFAFCSAYSHYALAGRIEGFRQVVEPGSETFHAIEARPGDEAAILDPAAFARELRSLPQPLAVMALDDATANLVVVACEMAGLLVPEQVAVVGCNSSALCEASSVLLSSVDPDFARQGHEAVLLLERLMAGEPPPAAPIRIPPAALGVRESSDIFAIENVTVARAVKFIIQRWRLPELCVDVVAEAVGFSRAHIESLFREHLDSGVAEYIRNMRIRQVKTLLLKSQASIQEITAYAGFRCPSHLSRLFSKATGLSPRAWRNEHALEHASHA